MFTKAFSTKARISDQIYQSRISDYQVLTHYFDISKLPCKISNPLRKDENPSMGIRMYENGYVLFKDFATDEKYNVYQMLSQLWNLNITDTKEKIISDICGISDKKQVNTKAKTKRKPKISRVSEISVKFRDWNKDDISYWSEYGVPIQYLEYAWVKPISHIFYKYEEGYTYSVKADPLAYAFIENKENKITTKIYQPKNKKGFKWQSKHSDGVISLWHTIEQGGEYLVICSSVKDALCLTANIGIPAIAPQGESYSFSDTAVNTLNKLFKKIVILYDNDNPGIKDAKKLSSNTGWEYKELPQFPEGKDISDYYKAKGKQQFKKTINQVLFKRNGETRQN